MAIDKVGTTSVNSGPVITLSLQEYKKMEIREDMYRNWIKQLIVNDVILREHFKELFQGPLYK